MSKGHQAPCPYADADEDIPIGEFGCTCPREDEWTPGYIEDSRCRGQDKGSHALYFRQAVGPVWMNKYKDTFILRAPSGSFPGSAYAPATEKSLGQIALFFDGKFVWKHEG